MRQMQNMVLGGFELENELQKQPWETMVPGNLKDEQDLFDCPILKRMSGGKASKVDWVTCYHDMNTSIWPISRGRCKEVYTVCMNCKNDPMIEENLVMPANFQYSTLEEAQEEWTTMFLK